MFVQLLSVDGRELWVNPAHVELFCPDGRDPVNTSVIVIRGEEYHVRIAAVALERTLLDQGQPRQQDAAILRREPSGPQGRTTAWRTRCWYCRTRVDAVTEKAVPGWVGQHPLCDSCSQTVRP